MGIYIAGQNIDFSKTKYIINDVYEEYEYKSVGSDAKSDFVINGGFFTMNPSANTPRFRMPLDKIFVVDSLSSTAELQPLTSVTAADTSKFTLENMQIIVSAKEYSNDVATGAITDPKLFEVKNEVCKVSFDVYSNADLQKELYMNVRIYRDNILHSFTSSIDGSLMTYKALYFGGIVGDLKYDGKYVVSNDINNCCFCDNSNATLLEGRTSYTISKTSGVTFIEQDSTTKTKTLIYNSEMYSGDIVPSPSTVINTNIIKYFPIAQFLLPSTSDYSENDYFYGASARPGRTNICSVYGGMEITSYEL